MDVLFFVAGLLLGGSLISIVMIFRRSGVLRVDRSLPEDNPYLFLELSKSIEAVSKKRYVMFKVSNKNYISHK